MMLPAPAESKDFFRRFSGPSLATHRLKLVH